MIKILVCRVFDTTKYRCLLCKFPLCNKCSLPIRENDEIRGWKAGKFVGYCVPCAEETFEQGTHTQHMLSEEKMLSQFPV